MSIQRKVPPTQPVQVVCVGESLVMFVPEHPAPGPHRLAMHLPTIAGAESNVAAYLASMGVGSAWISRVGSDQFGDFILGELHHLGVNVEKTDQASTRSTGVAFKQFSNGRTAVHYYRRGSAASTMGPEVQAAVDGFSPLIVHMSGITPPLSSSCHDLVHALMRSRPEGRLISFDLNWRPALWEGQDPSVLLSLARMADIVFVGDDEASALWSTADVADIHALLPGVTTLVVKHGPRGATVVSGEDSVFVPALDLEVVEAVGAGDAFAAGFLAGTVTGRSLRDRGRLGTILAGTALGTVADIAPAPSAAAIESLLALSEAEWATATLEDHHPTEARQPTGG